MRSKWVWLAGGIGLAVILAAIIGGAAWFLFGGADEETVAVTPAPTTVADVAPTETATATAMPVEDPPPAGDVETEATATLLPTSTPVDTPSPTPIPLEPTPVPVTPPPSEAQILFEDDFETGLDAAWNTKQVTDKNVVNGELLANGILELTVDNQNWNNYRVSFELGSKTNLTNLTLNVRMQDGSNYLMMECVSPAPGEENLLNCVWAKIIGGSRGANLLGTEFTLPQAGPVTVEMEGNAYRVNGDMLQFVDTESSFLTGGIKFIATGQPLSLNYFKVEAIP